MNYCVLIGRLTRDPEVRYAGTGEQTAVANFTLAIDRFSKEREKQTDFLRIVAFGRQAELCEKYLSKGRLVALQGRIQTGSYKNKDGVTVYTTDIVADRVEFIDWGDKAPRSSFAGEGSQIPGFERPSYEGGVPQEPGLPEGFTALDDDDIPF